VANASLLDEATARERGCLGVVVHVAVARRQQLGVSACSSRSNNARVTVSPARIPVCASSSVSVAALCSYSHRMLRRISSVAMSSIR
jgi:hypothetical protein